MLYHREGENAAEGRKISENDMLFPTNNIKCEQVFISLDGVQVASSKHVELQLTPEPEQEKEQSEYNPANLSASWTIAGTHKNVRQLRKLRKELNLHKPRLPRKLKKQLKKLYNHYDTTTTNNRH